MVIRKRSGLYFWLENDMTLVHKKCLFGSSTLYTFYGMNSDLSVYKVCCLSVLLGSYNTLWCLPWHASGGQWLLCKYTCSMVSPLSPLSTLWDLTWWFVGLYMLELFIRYYSLIFIVWSPSKNEIQVQWH